MRFNFYSFLGILKNIFNERGRNGTLKENKPEKNTVTLSGLVSLIGEKFFLLFYNPARICFKGFSEHYDGPVQIFFLQYVGYTYLVPS